MANGIHDVYTGQMQGVNPEQLQRIAQAQAAKSQLSGMSNSPAMVAALRDYKTPMPEVQGRGLATTAPNPLEAISAAVLRNRGDQRLNSMDKQAQALRGQITEGSIAEQTSALQAKDYANKMGAQKSELDRQNRLADQIAQEKRAATAAAKKRTRVAFHDPVDPTKTLNLEQDGMGNWYRGGESIDAKFVENLTPFTAPDTGSIGYKERKDDIDREVALQNKILEIDLAGNVITDPDLHSATGPWFDVKKRLADVGIMPDSQAAQTDAQALGLKGAAPILAFLGKPTDRDLEEALKAGPNPSKEPKTFLNWYESTYTPAMISAFTNSEKKEMVPALKAQMEETLKKGYAVQYPQEYKERFPEHYQKSLQTEASDKVTAAQAKVDKLRAQLAAEQKQ